MQMLDRRPRQRKPVVRRRAAAHLIQQHQRARCRRVQNRRRLRHLHHERRPPARHVIARANARIDAIHQPQPHPLRRHKAAALRHDHQQRRLAQIRALAAHVRPGDQQQRRLAGSRVARAQMQRVRHKSPRALVLQPPLDHRMPARHELQHPARIHLRPHPSAQRRQMREAAQQIDARDHAARSRASAPRSPATAAAARQRCAARSPPTAPARSESSPPAPSAPES